MEGGEPIGWWLMRAYTTSNLREYLSVHPGSSCQLPEPLGTTMWTNLT